ncbi:hypothetical protein AURDEDRAFT_114734 [Auricularia subglabra TFB-10046 SS5]|nr:hypothetical protein AURDEDRAFT_114734 [Auricularia subglabra TFB-10046 SS5]
MLFLPVNLPWPILLHALGLVALGLLLLFSTPQRPGQDKSVLGVATVALGLAYIATAYGPQADNQFLYASVPVRMLLASLAGIRWATVRHRDARLYDGANALLVIALYDGLGGAALGWYLGSYSGKTLAFR